MLRRRRQTKPADLVLDGEDLELLELKINGKPWIGENRKPLHSKTGSKKEKFRFLPDGKLVIPEEFLSQGDSAHSIIDTVVDIRPRENLKLKGLFVSGNTLVTHCEPEGFRRITYFLDRPDILSNYTVGAPTNFDSLTITNVDGAVCINNALRTYET